MDIRLQQLTEWVRNDLALSPCDISPASADASYRRYFRVRTRQRSYIAMDAPPEKGDIRPFVEAAKALTTVQVNVPEIHHENAEQGFMLLQDFGERTYLSELPARPEKLYQQAINTLLKIQQGSTTEGNQSIPIYSRKILDQELDLFEEWFINKHLKSTLNKTSSSVLKQTKTLLIDVCQQQPQVWVHRDFHSRNLMVTCDTTPGVIDFQDMLIGPIAYDLASLFKDCYIEWPRERQLDWLANYYEKAVTQLSMPEFSFAQLVRWYDLTGLQRHLKVLGIFCRLNYRDDKAMYLADLPLVASYVLEVLNLYRELDDFKLHFSDLVARAL